MFIWTMLFIVVNFISVIMLLYYSIKINAKFMKNVATRSLNLT